jgi:hypothetical protein
VTENGNRPVEECFKTYHDTQTCGQQDRVAYLRGLGIGVEKAPLWWDMAVMHVQDWERHKRDAGMPGATAPPVWLFLSSEIPLGQVYVWNSAMPPEMLTTTATNAGGL